MKVSTRTTTVQQHYIEIDGKEYGTTFQADEYIEPKVETEGNKTVITYAAREEYPDNPREMFEPAGTMVRVCDGYKGIEIDQPDSEFSALYELAEKVQYAARQNQNEVYFATVCSCAWNGHSIEEVEAGECAYPYSVLIFGTDEDIFEDGSSWGIEFPLDGYGDLTSTEGVAAMLAAGLEANALTSVYELMEAYVEVGMPHVTAFIEWSIQGYSQSDWAEGYIYTTVEGFVDPEAALLDEVAEYDAWAKGDVYLVVREEYIDGEQVDYECVGGYTVVNGWGYTEENLETILYVQTGNRTFEQAGFFEEEQECEWFVNNGTAPAWCCNTHMFDGTGDYPATEDHPEDCDFKEEA